MFTQMQTKLITMGIGVILTLIVIFSTAGINDAGYRTVIQYPNGTINIKFSPGWYLSWFGSTESYPDVVTFDYSGKGEDASIASKNIPVRYQDGGMGSINGISRFNLPNDFEQMFKLHKAFRDNYGLANKLLRKATEESMNMTAGLMTSEAAYAENRNTFIQQSREQLSKGIYKTRLRQASVKDEVTGKITTKNVPEIVYGENGLPVHVDNDLGDYGISVSGFQITNWGFEKKTLDQISLKRKETMAIITAVAAAERAKQEEITAEAEGKKNVKVAHYEKEVLKAQAMVEAEKDKQVATIQAEKLVEVAKQNKLEAEQKKLAAVQYKQEQILIGEGDGERKRLVMEADGALAQKLDAWKEVNLRFAQAVEKQRWVPEIVMTSGNGGYTGQGSSAAQTLIEMLTVKTAKDLQLNMGMRSNVTN